MSKIIDEMFHTAYAEESKAALRLKLYADRADMDGYPQIAKLFRAISISEEIHGLRSLKMLKQIKSTDENLASSFTSETRIAGAAYDDFIKKAGEEGNSQAELIFSQTRDVEDVHSKLYKRAMDHVIEETEATYYICEVCGYVSDSLLPDKCPVCGAGKEHFRTF